MYSDDTYDDLVDDLEFSLDMAEDYSDMGLDNTADSYLSEAADILEDLEDGDF